MAGRPKDIKQDASLPLNAQFFQSTVGVTSEGFQVGGAAALAHVARSAEVHAAR